MQKTGKENKSAQFTVKDVVILENPQIYSSLGRMINSNKRTEPAYGFGTSNRQKTEKVFATKQLSKAQFLGKTGPGPVYTPAFEKCKPAAPQYSFGNDARNTLDIKAKYDHYGIVDKYSDVNTADMKRRVESTGTKFRSTRRVRLLV